eukprot:6145991-Pyramimonas_sp.AAC.1
MVPSCLPPFRKTVGAGPRPAPLPAAVAIAASSAKGKASGPLMMRTNMDLQLEQMDEGQVARWTCQARWLDRLVVPRGVIDRAHYPPPRRPSRNPSSCHSKHAASPPSFDGKQLRHRGH